MKWTNNRTLLYLIMLSIVASFFMVSHAFATEASNAQTSVGQVLEPPLAPIGLVATTNSRVVGMRWYGMQNSEGFTVKRSTTAGGPYTVIANTSNWGYFDYDVTTGTTYYYVVSAWNSAGESPNSTEVSATPGS